MEKGQRVTKLSIIFSILVIGTALLTEPSEAAPQGYYEIAPEEYYEEYFRDAREVSSPDQPESLATQSLLPIEEEYAPASQYTIRSVPPHYNPAVANVYAPPAAEVPYDAQAAQPPNPVQPVYYYHQAPAPPMPGNPVAQPVYNHAPVQAAPAQPPPYEAHHYPQAQHFQPPQPEAANYANNQLQPAQPAPPQHEAASYVNNRLQPPQLAQHPQMALHPQMAQPPQLNQPPQLAQSPQMSQPPQLAQHMSRIPSPQRAQSNNANNRQANARTEIQSYLNGASNRLPAAEQPEMPSNGNQRPADSLTPPEARFYEAPNNRQPPVAMEARAQNAPNGRHPPPPPPPRFRYPQSDYYQPAPPPPAGFRSISYNPYSMPDYQTPMYTGYSRNILEEDDEELSYAKYPRSPDDTQRIEQPAQYTIGLDDRQNPYMTFREYNKGGNVDDNRSRGGDKLYVIYRADQSDGDLESIVRQAIDIARQQRAQDRYRHERAYLQNNSEEEEEDDEPVFFTGLATSNDRYDLGDGKVVSTDGQYVLQKDQNDSTKWIAVPTKTMEGSYEKILENKDNREAASETIESNNKSETDKRMDFVEDMELPLTPTEPSNFDRSTAETTTSS